MAESWVSRAELEELLGAQAAALMMRTYGGVPVYIPKQAWAGTELSRLVGVPALEKLAALYGGDRITVPNGRKPDPHKGRIIQMLDDGLTPSAIARRLGVTERYVWAVSRQCRRHPRQLMFF